VFRTSLKRPSFLPMQHFMDGPMPLSEPSSTAGRGRYRRDVSSTASAEPNTAEPESLNRLRVGIDLVEVDEVAATLHSNLGARYLSRIYTSREVEDCLRDREVDPIKLAGRFAAKEAAMKALRVGDRAVSWREVEVHRAEDGAPTLVLRGAAAALASEAGLAHFAVSMTHERKYASAIVVATP
jgi:holo-[acyl-carrier protein] synthase